ncbi:penicillin binding protein PBP4B [Peribacillus psychrosaccharolyticus]|uniref:Penicillin binding protein PBP4B n=1 Tax=Peribacillus psychrosaccharolyticus TaxID=1407 RepID=A0A974NN26_PERPY|nr:penicillin binding protein PBP4B [Peribacillus psychrosaccharolyticus]MEC2056149.1 penicillin binding protein PBP4B [Peribacillus psychrosaccharolyticus]MED3745589.1 penicillin binding protein PBP4B [Peribacillus psychrosaccharolyticus]QQT00660.1 penicillin binding protein PBP4B [Peribacillus psychrosaccharolyticus]
MKKIVNVAVTSLLTISLFAAGTPAALAGTNYSAPYVKEKQVQYPVLKKAKKPEEAGFSYKKLQQIDGMIQEEVEEGFPGAVLLIIKDGKVVKNTAYGYAKKYDNLTLLKHPQKMKPDTLFDLASNTKMYSVNFALQQLVSKGKLDINQTVQHYIPEFKDQEADLIKGKDKLRVIDILHHSAGFPADPQYHNPSVAKDLYSQDRNTTLKMISKTPLEYEPGTKNIYSDVDYMLLGYIIEKVTGERLDQYVDKHIYKPLGLKHTYFNPLEHGFKPKDFAATELMGNTRDGVISFPNIRTYTLQGEVHDEKAFYAMNGISGHAGLFSNTEDLAVLLQVMLNNGGYGKVKVFDQKVIDQFTAPSELNPTYGLGWRRNGNESMEWMFGPYASENVVGHTGWTGTVTVIDREKNLGIVLLTNKKHSPLIDPLINPNKSEGDVFNTGQYGSVVTAVYEALMENQK